MVGPAAHIRRPEGLQRRGESAGVVEGLRQEQHPLGVPELALQASQAGVRSREGQRQLEPGPLRSCHPLECLPARLGDGHSRGVVTQRRQTQRGVAQSGGGPPRADRVVHHPEEGQGGLRVQARLGTVTCVLRDLGCEEVQPGLVVVAVRALQGELEEALGLPGGSDPACPGSGPLQVGAGTCRQRRAAPVLVGGGVDRVEEVSGDDDGEVVARVRKLGEVVGGGEVPGRAVAAGLGRVRDLPNHRLDEPVLAELGAEPVGLEGDDLLAAQGVQQLLDVVPGGPAAR